jgi:hypothetical protein
MEYDRGEVLQAQFNEYWSSMLGEEKDYFSSMTVEHFERLKYVLSNINNIITYKASILLAEFLSDILSLSPSEKEKLLSFAKKQNPNANGYDIVCSEEIKLVAEIKCNLPVNSTNRFGGAQVKGINGDIRGLFNGKPGFEPETLWNYYKILGIYRFDENTEQAVLHHLSNLPEDLRGFVELYDKGKTVMGKDKVYVILISK